MFLLDADKFSDIHYLLLGEEKWDYLPQVLLKCLVMFIVVVITLRFIDRRGIMQGVFETLTIIMLGSAAGDPMLYKNVGLLPAILIFFCIGAFYRITNHYVAKYSRLETLVEGRAVRFIKDGRFEVEHFNSNELSKDEIFSNLRQEGVSHLGQIKTAYIEPGGEVSIFYYEDEEVEWGRPTLPELTEKRLVKIEEEGNYSCEFCGYTERLRPAKEHKCRVCKRTEWIRAIKEKRIT